MLPDRRERLQQRGTSHGAGQRARPQRPTTTSHEAEKVSLPGPKKAHPVAKPIGRPPTARGEPCGWGVATCRGATFCPPRVYTGRSATLSHGSCGQPCARLRRPVPRRLPRLPLSCRHQARAPFHARSFAYSEPACSRRRHRVPAKLVSLGAPFRVYAQDSCLPPRFSTPATRGRGRPGTPPARTGFDAVGFVRALQPSTRPRDESRERGLAE